MSRQLLIGEFSKKTGVSARMLRHFDKIGLLMPDNVDKITGYRYYCEHQITIAQSIVFFQSLGFSLIEIKNLIIEDDCNAWMNTFLTQEAKLKTQKRIVNHQLLKVNQFINEALLKIPSTGVVQSHIERSLSAVNTKQKYLQANYLISTDEFKSEMQAYLNQDVCGALIEVDIDHFDLINQNYGYEVGDLVTSILFNILMERVAVFYNRDEKNLITRFGGDDFKLFIRDTPPEELKKPLNSALKAFKMWDFESIDVASTQSFSAGIIDIKGYKHYGEVETAVTKAVVAAKRKGRSNVVIA